MNLNLNESQPVFLKRVLIVAGVATTIFILLFLFWRIREILVLLFAGILGGIFLASIANWLQHHTPLSQRQSFAVTMVILTAVLALAGAFAIPQLIRQGEQLSSDLADSIDNLESTLSRQDWFQSITDQFPNTDGTNSFSMDVLGQATNFFSAAFFFLSRWFVIFFVGIYLAFEPALYANGALRLVPKGYRRRAGEIFTELAYSLRWWLIGRLASMLIVGVFTVVGLLLLGIPLALILGLLAGLLAFIPLFGPLLSLLPPMLIAFTDSPQLALYVLLLYLGIQVVESYFLTPLIQRKATSLPPVILILSQAVMAVFFGFMGVVFAAPLAVVIVVSVKMIYVQDVLNDEEIELLKENPQSHFEVS